MKNWRGKEVQCFKKLTGGDEVTLEVGDIVLFSNTREAATVAHLEPPYKASSTGKIYIKTEEGSQDYYPSVFDCEFREVE